MLPAHVAHLCHTPSRVRVRPRIGTSLNSRSLPDPGLSSWTAPSLTLTLERGNRATSGRARHAEPQAAMGADRASAGRGCGRIVRAVAADHVARELGKL